MTKRPKTPHRGAAGERAAILRKVRAMMRMEHATDLDFQFSHAWCVLDSLAGWIQARDVRYKARKGGL